MFPIDQAGVMLRLLLRNGPSAISVAGLGLIASILSPIRR